MKKPTVFLGNSPWLDPADATRYGVRAGSRWPHFQHLKTPGTQPNYIPFPHYLAIAAACLEREGVRVALVDGVGEGISLEEFCARATGFSPDLVVLEVSTPSIGWDLMVVHRLRARLPGDCAIALAGPHAPMYRPDFLDRNTDVDFVLTGEYEETLVELVRALEEGSPENVRGLIWRPENRAVANALRPPIAALDSLPGYADRFLPMTRYNDRPCNLPGPSLQMWTSRGCPFGCTFCQWPQVMYGGRSYRTRDPQRVVDECVRLVGAHGIKSVYFDDDTFNVRRDRTLMFARLMREYLPGLPWAAMARADLMDEELIGELARSGLYSVKYGVESADPKILESSGKSLDLAKVERAVALTRAAGIKVQLTFTFGFPAETSQTLERSIEFACRMNPDYVQFSILTPFPGTKLFDELLESGYIVDTDFSHYSGSSQAVVRTDALEPAQLVEAVRTAYRRYFAARAGEGA